nr:immunoglobulin heavy chain junction region [Mus musculus]MBK4183724.1 immunoglobulin heavy chain junction region [Mus musculus]
CVSGNGWFAYW